MQASVLYCRRKCTWIEAVRQKCELFASEAFFVSFAVLSCPSVEGRSEMGALVTAGGIPDPDEPLYEYTQGKPKAMLDICGKPMVQWVLNALEGARTVDRIVVAGLPPDSGVSCFKPSAFVPNQGGLLQNVRAGLRRLLEINPTAHHVLLVASDIPAITCAMVDWVVTTAMKNDEDVFYSIITRQLMESRFPGSKRPFPFDYAHLRNIVACGGQMHVARIKVLIENDELWEQIVAARKSAFKKTALIRDYFGYSGLISILLSTVNLDGAVEKVAKRLQMNGRAVLCPYAEVGMDVDKPHQLEMVRAELARRVAPREGVLQTSAPAL